MSRTPKISEKLFTTLASYYLIFCLVFLFPEQIFSDETTGKIAKGNASSIRHLTMDNGLPSKTITGIAADENQFIWIATNKGFCRWDGFNAICYQPIPGDSSSLPDNHIPRNGFKWDAQRKKLLIGTNQGLSLFDPATLEFQNFFIDPDNSLKIPAPINVVFTDRQDLIWLGTDNGFSMMLPNGNSFKNFTFKDDFPEYVMLDQRSINRVFDIRQDPEDDNVLWLATLAGLLRFTKSTEKLQWFYYPAEDYLRELNLFTMLVPGEEGMIYLGTWNFDMVQFDSKNEKFTGRFGRSPGSTIHTDERIFPYAHAGKDAIWISSLNGLGTINPKTGDIDYIFSLKNEHNHRLVPELFYRDGDRHLWLGSENGVYVLSLDYGPVKNHFFRPVDENHWYITRSLFEDTISNTLLIGYGRGEGLHFFDLKTSQFRVINYPIHNISEHVVSAILPAPSGGIFMLTPDALYDYSPKNQQVKLLFSSRATMHDMKSDSQGNLWIASANQGLSVLKPGQMKPVQTGEMYHDFGGSQNLPMFQELVIDNHDRIWFRRRGESYGYYDPAKDSLIYFRKRDKLFDITCFGPPDDKLIWAATAENGIGFIDAEEPDKGIQIVFPPDSLPYGLISNLLVDRSNKIWALCEMGLLRLDPESGEKVLFDENHGIAVRDNWSDKNNLVPGKLQLLKDGRIAIGYRHGLGFFHPDSLKPVYKVPEPYLTAIRINEENIPVNENMKLRLPFDQNNLGFSYSAHALYNRGIILQHKIQAIDPDWHTQLPGKQVFYPNLRPGKYRLILRSSSLSGQGGEKFNHFDFVIRSPWWKTGWAYATYVALFGLLIVIIYRFQLNRQLARRENHRLRELNELKTRLYANITHEFRTPITVITGIADDLAGRQYDRNLFKNKLETIQRNSDSLLHLVNQL
ncbi:MAG: hypothetical protein KDC05_00585, partial [Bacteroidales bacterium]|nr:hypothetical protein [Bacteroidales bacterium]